MPGLSKISLQPLRPKWPSVLKRRPRGLTVAKDEQRRRKRVQIEGMNDDGGQAVNGFAHVGAAARQIHPFDGNAPQHSDFTTRRMSARSVGSNPWRTWIATRPTDKLMLSSSAWGRPGSARLSGLCPRQRRQPIAAPLYGLFREWALPLGPGILPGEAWATN
jgi:hypothetical protein